MLSEKVEVRGEEEREEREKFLIFEAMASTITWGYVGLGASQVALVPMQGTRDAGSIPGPGRFSGGGHGNSLQYSCLENPRGSWRATVHGVTKSWTLLKGFSTHACGARLDFY